MSRTASSRSGSASVRLSTGTTTSIYTVLLLVAALALAGAIFYTVYELALRYDVPVPFGETAAKSRKAIDDAQKTAKEVRDPLVADSENPQEPLAPSEPAPDEAAPEDTAWDDAAPEDDAPEADTAEDDVFEDIEE
ncbi:MAG: hypothetical protein QGD94_02680 [Planctomycetia bacterium]|nr:hypothetical protein [Planctomycetia bacterium]